MKVISIFNIKGGCGKTLTAQALLEGLRAKGYKVCGVDLDTQHNLTDSFKFTPSFTIIDLIFKTKPLSEIKKTDFIASSLEFSRVDTNTLDSGIFLTAFKELNKYYDYVIIDLPPSLNNLANIILSVSDGLIIPSECDIYNIDGVNNLIKVIRNTKLKIKVLGVLITRYNDRTKISKQLNELLNNLVKKNNTPLYKTKIRESIAIKELRALKEPLLTYGGGKANAQRDYKAFIKEFLESENN